MREAEELQRDEYLAASEGFPAGRRPNPSERPPTNTVRVRPGATYNSTMATRPRNIRLTPDSYALLEREARRRGTQPDALADELLRADLGGPTDGLDVALAGLAELRERLPEIDGVALARGARRELEDRGA